MQFTGSELILKRNFYTQTGHYGFVLNANVDNTTGKYLFGLTGNNGKIEFKLESGRIYYENQFIHAYKSYEEFSIEARFTSGSANILKNNIPLCYNNPKATGYFDYFYFSRNNASMGATFDVEISGNNSPIYSITQQGYLFASGQSGVTGYFSNSSSLPMNIFASQIQATEPYNFGSLVGNVSGMKTGIFAYSGDFDSFDLSDPILTTFNTNFGDIEINFYIIDTRTLNKFVQFSAPTDFTFNSTGILNRDLIYLNYSGGFVTDIFNTSLVFQLGYVSGSGQAKTFTGSWDLLTGVNANSLASMKSAGQYNSTLISGSGIFPPNSQINFQVTYTTMGTGADGCYLIITGQEVINSIYQNLTYN